MNPRAEQSGRTIGAFLLIGLGVLFLLGQFVPGFNVWNLIGEFWPFFVILPGLGLVAVAWMGGRGASGFMVPGAIVTGTGLILLFQNVTDRWESWAYVWALYPVFLGLGLMFIGRRSESGDAARAGRAFVQWGLIMFVVFAAFFELLLFNASLGNVAVPLLLIGLGLWMLLRSGLVPGLSGGRRGGGSGRRSGGSPRKRSYDDEPVFTGAPVIDNPDAVRRVDASDRLRAEIDAALVSEARARPPVVEPTDEPTGEPAPQPAPQPEPAAPAPDGDDSDD